jgi:hypothetical protein
MLQAEFLNPFALTPTSAGNSQATPDVAASELADYESIRRQYLKHERAVNSVSSVLFFSALLSLFASVLVVALPFLYMLYEEARLTGSMIAVCLVLSVSLIALVILQAMVAMAVRQNFSKARSAAILLAILGMFAFPFGTICGIYILVVMGAKDTPFVMSEEYKKVKRATPQYDAAPVSWVMVTLVGFAIIATLATLLAIG